MRRDAHPPDARAHFLIPIRPAAAIALLALALTLATGALASPFLLLLPIATLVLLLGLDRSEARWAVGFGTLALLAGDAAAGSLGMLRAGAALLAAGVLLAFAERLRRRQPLRSTARTEVTLPAPEDAATMRSRELQELLERTRAWTGAVALTVWRCEQDVARPAASAGRLPPPPRVLEGDPLGWVAREGTPIWFAAAPAWSEPGASVAAARLRADSRHSWIVTSEFATEQGRPTHEDLAAAHGALRLFLDVLAAQEQTEAGQVRLGRLLVLLRRIPVEMEAAAFGSELLAAAMSLTDATGGTLGSWIDGEGEIVVSAGDEGGPAAGTRFTAPHSELALAVRAGAAIERTGGRWRPGATQLAADTDHWTILPRTLLCVPLATPSGVAGVLGLWSSRAERLDPDALDLLQTVLPYAALHMEHAREFGRLRDHADHDPLTGLRNRRGFDAAFLSERLRFERYGHALSVLMLDIDHFKRINDEHGHDAGDEVLRVVATVLRNVIRDVDVPSRHGGEEFVVLLPETPATAAAEVAERVRSAVAAAQITVAGARIAVRLSVGVSACPELVAVPADLLPSADAALYQAKRDGRDRVVVATAKAPGPTPGPRVPRAR